MTLLRSQKKLFVSGLISLITLPAALAQKSADVYVDKSGVMRWGIKVILTPIAHWGNGWPEPDEKTHGFSAKYGKGESLTNPDATKAQENYLYQFLNHVNPYTNVACKNEPDLIAFEISNEPHHGGTSADVTAFIKRHGGVDAQNGLQKTCLLQYQPQHSLSRRVF